MLSDDVKACAVPWNSAWTLGGRWMSSSALLIASTACPSDALAERLKESVTEGNWPWWSTESAVVVGTACAIARSGMAAPVGLLT